MHRAGTHEKHIAGVYRHTVEHLADRAVLRPPPQLVRRHGARKAEKERALRLAVHHIPHLRLALLALFAAGGRIRRMYLNGKVLLRVYQFDEQRERRNAAARARHTDGIGAQDIRQTLTAMLAGINVRLPVGAHGELPALGDNALTGFMILPAQARASPEIAPKARLEPQRFVFLRFFHDRRLLLSF